MSEHIYQLIGGNGNVQYFYLFLVCYVQMNTSLNILAPIFINNYQDIFCNVGMNMSQHTFSLYRPQFKSIDNTTGILVIDSQRCQYQTIQNICSEIYLKPDPMTSTIRSQYHLYCEYDRLSSFSVFLFMIGIFFGSLFGGVFCDKFGRIPCCFLGYSMMAIFSTIGAVSPWFILHAIARLFLGFSVTVCFVPNYTMFVELCDLNCRTSFGFFISIGFDCGYIVLVGLAYVIRNHYHLQIVICCLSYLSLIVPFFLKESFRWLLVNKKYEKAKVVLKYFAHFNKRTVTDDQINQVIQIFEDDIVKRSIKSVSLKEVLRFKVVLVNLIILWFLYFSSAFSYYTFTLGSAKISDRIFTATTIGAIGCLVVRIIYMLCCKRLGRVTILMSQQLGIAIFFVTSMIVKYFMGRNNLITIILVMISITLSNSQFGFMWIYGGETFPTVIRGTSVSIGSACSRIAGMIASQMDWVFEVSPNALPIVGALMAIVGSLCTFFILPETFQRPSLDFLYQAEKYFVEWRQPWRKNANKEKYLNKDNDPLMQI